MSDERTKRSSRTGRWAWIAFALALLACNPHLIGGAFPAALAFRPAAFGGGAWWQAITHHLVHYSWWHLLLNAGAFAMLWSGLETRSIARRALYAAGATAGSLGAACLASTTVTSAGLCGLSGLAHGLMAIYGLETMERARGDRVLYRIGLLCFVSVAIKVALEAITGEVFLAMLHLGRTGIPIAVCHAGGVVGGLLAFGSSRPRRASS